MGPLVVALLLAGCIAAESDFHNDLSSEDLHRYFGVHVKEKVPPYEIVSPVLTEGSPHRSSLFGAKPPLKYKMTAFGEDFRLNLEHNDQLIAPGCLIHYLHSNGTRKAARPCPTHENDCYYQGTSLDHDGSEASLSTCNGLHGLIRLPNRDHDVWIQPVEERHVARARRSTGSTLSHPHIVYKRAVIDRQCATQGVPEVISLLSEVRSAARARRAAGDKYAEMLLVADKTMHQHYRDTLREYLLTVANIAARILLDPSIGTPVHFTVVKIQILQADQPGLDITDDADATLDSFCGWQEQTNPQDDSNPQHHDGAALFTRLDIIHAGVRDTTGFATVAGMCGKKTRCLIAEDTGLGVGLTLAHETGHTLGMLHDGAGNSCEDGKNVMSSMGGGGHTAMFWSTCSRQSYADFLSTTKSECLNDRPQDSVALPKDLPGVVYNGDDQCELYIGPGSTLCEGTGMVEGDECTHLVCFDPQESGVCKGDSVPRLDGTMCGDRKFCMHGTCVDITDARYQPRNGGWSDWETQWSSCSRTCGGGVRVRRRKCDNPKPQFGGRECDGSSIMAELCNMQDCQSSGQEFRESQCAQTDSIPFNGQTHHWVPVNMLGEQECELHCRIDGQRMSYLRHIDGRSWYLDGTVCASVNSSFGRCIAGKCRDFGCDGKTSSRYQFDRCGVCGGQGNTCRKQSGTYSQGRKQEYVTFVTVPKGSTSVRITNANKFTMMSVRIAGKRIFSEDGSAADPSGTYTANSIVVDYRSPSSGMETITITGPLPEPVEAQVWRKFADTEFQGVAPQINYEYFVPSSTQPQNNYVWKAENGACSKTCGGGLYNRVLTCTRRGSSARVDDHFCDLRQKPAATGSACNTQACPARWRAGWFSQCSKTCGGGQQTRTVECVQDRGGRVDVVAATNCPADRRPAETQQCNVNVACPAIWVTGDWSACSLTCGKGVHSRTVKCVKDESSSQPVSESQCTGTKPDTTEACVNAVCHPEITGSRCQNKDETCASYGLTMCQDYASFAEGSCMKHCYFCGELDVGCTDKNSDCSGYGVSICTGEYTDWARENCAKMCGFCNDGTTSIATTPATCEDKSGDCAGYGQNICAGDYADWAKDNCAKFCGHCPAATTAATATAGACADKSGDCAGYGQDICSGQYADWAKDNCAKFCGACPGGSGGSAGAGETTTATTPKPSATTTVPPTTTTTTPRPTTTTTTPQPTTTIPTTTTTPQPTTTTTTPQPTTTTPTTTTTPQPTTTTPSTTTTASTPSTTVAAATSAAVSSNCQDASVNCAAFGTSFCTQSEYSDWAKTNCARYCNLCPASVQPSLEPCQDQLATCDVYGHEVCSNQAYREWARINCQKFCGLCSGGATATGAAATTTTVATTTTTATPKPTSTTTPKPKASDATVFCVDTASNCQQYSRAFCSQPAYTAWARENCASYCNLCPTQHAMHATSPTSASVTTSTPRPTTQASTAAVTGSACVDAGGDCSQYGISFCSQAEYADWAKENCARHCKFCHSDESVICEDKLETCAQYGQDVCRNSDYAEWAALNCAKFCGVCPTGQTTTAAQTTTVTTATTTTTTPSTTTTTTTPAVTTTTQVASTAVVATSPSACKDVDSNCAGYGTSFCTDEQYADFAKDNCARHCNLCPDSTTVPVECKDQLDNCLMYGKDVCQNATYKEWARMNCAKFCGVCSTGGALPAQTTATAATTKKAADTTVKTDSPCQDIFDNCAGYGVSVCTNSYADWAAVNCRQFCNLCPAQDSIGGNGNGNGNGDKSGSGNSGDSGIGTATNDDSACEDKSGDCADYGQSICTGEYAAWAGDNCAKFCNRCGAATSATTTTTAATINNNGASCSDKVDNCAAYGQSVCSGTYAAWAETNCQKFCGLCSSSPSSSGSSSGGCVDTSTDCQAYGASVCTQYADWAAENCKSFCNKCGGRRRRSVLIPPPPRPFCNNVLTAPAGSLALIGKPVDASCTQVIVAPRGARVQVAFTALRISCEEGDWLEVKEEGGKVKGKKTHHDLCDQAAPVQWTTTGNVVTIKLSVSTPGHGYNLTYRVEPSPEVGNGCDRLLTNPSGALASPGFPAPYHSNKLCMTTIVAPPNFAVRLNFNLFHLESEDCGKDSVTVYDDEFGQKDVFCGIQSDFSWQSKGNKVKVIFASDEKKSGPGFLASYKFISP